MGRTEAARELARRTQPQRTQSGTEVTGSNQAAGATTGASLYATESDVEVLHIQGVVFNEFAAGFDVFAHKRAEDSFTLGDVFEPDRK
jgi:hypothetical protein